MEGLGSSVDCFRDTCGAVVIVGSALSDPEPLSDPANSSLNDFCGPAKAEKAFGLLLNAANASTAGAGALGVVEGGVDGEPKTPGFCPRLDDIPNFGDSDALTAGDTGAGVLNALPNADTGFSVLKKGEDVGVVLPNAPKPLAGLNAELDGVPKGDEEKAD